MKHLLTDVDGRQYFQTEAGHVVDEKNRLVSPEKEVLIRTIRLKQRVTVILNFKPKSKDKQP